MNMRKNILASLLVCGLAVMAVACGGNKKAEEAKDGKLTYTPQINEVTVGCRTEKRAAVQDNRKNRGYKCSERRICLRGLCDRHR